jgi:hypothetical protein
MELFVEYRLESAADKGYAVYATTFVKRDLKKVKLLQFLMIDSEGKLIAEGLGETTAGFYEGRLSQKKIMEVVRSFAQCELESLNLPGEVPIQNIALKNPVEIEQILSKVKTGRYERLKEFR